MLIDTLNTFPWFITMAIDAWNSIKRLQAFMDIKELNEQQYYSTGKFHSFQPSNHYKFVYSDAVIAEYQRGHSYLRMTNMYLG